MRKLIMWNIISLDGYFEGNENRELPFHEIIWGEELEKLSIEQLHSADYLVFGRVTSEGMETFWTKAIKSFKLTCPMHFAKLALFFLGEALPNPGFRQVR